MAAVSNLKNMALCLFATCFVCSGVLGGVYAVTKAPIEETNAAILKASVAKVLPEGEISASKPIEGRYFLPGWAHLRGLFNPWPGLRREAQLLPGQ